MKTKTRATAAAAGFALLLALSACSTAESDGGTGSTSNTADISEGVQPDPAAVALLPASVKDKGELEVAMDLHYPPTTFLADDSTTPIGLNPDVARLVAAKLGLELKFVNTSFDTIIPGIEGGRFDFTATSMSPTPERLEVLDMIDYFNGGVSVAVAAGNPEGLSNDDLCGKNIAVTKGSNAQLKHLPNVSEWTCVSQGKPAINGITLPNVQEALTQLASKRVDGVFYDTPALVWAEKQQPNAITVLTPQVDTRTEHFVTVALKKGSPLTPALQAAVQSVLDSPEYQKSLANWGLTVGAVSDAKLN
ncbi:ABC transporter substrate-binding protein (plasmid) [Rhodococcus opacus]|uniref:PAAT family amino acid ABC transporter substrate-binding protein n=1 Tax=Rhodococcus opacus M213 TaxID=1129896 RepID=K8XXX2_RHOOP|nr:ABC transporter substrate-binding protein [Rhodococcus opacus]EKT82025.1 PAAT family amino acid ABC transporter substrate-binding protein [Rhodococcus opacus M213]MDV7088829.1 ABC transporter substrate-binding protein [Rhodococcus opacus]WKN60064.1 ABC transporter substrate-binding protein [Rhodococcus opacus]